MPLPFRSALRSLPILSAAGFSVLSPNDGLAQVPAARFPEDPTPGDASAAPANESDASAPPTQALPEPPPSSSEPREGDAPPASSTLASGTEPSDFSVDEVALPEADWSAWQSEFAKTRLLMESGRFLEAANRFDALSRRAPTAEQGWLARELGVLCATWAERGLALRPPAAEEALGGAATEAHPAGRAAGDRRSTGEIALLYTNSVLYGIGTGVWLGILTEPDTAAGAILPTLAVSGLSAGVVAFVDRGEGLRAGVPQSITTGMWLGLSQGVLWAGYQSAASKYYEEWEARSVATLIWGATTAGAIAGGVIGQESGTTEGRSAWVGSTGLWGGTLGGLVVGALASDDYEADEKALLGAAVGLTGGAVVGLVTAGEVSPTIGRVRFLDLGGLAGGLVVGGLYVAGADDNVDGQGLLGSTALGVAAGLGTAWLLTEGMPKDYGFDEAPEQPTGLDSARVVMAPTEGGGLLSVGGVF